MAAIFASLRIGWDFFAALCERGVQLVAIVTFCQRILRGGQTGASGPDEERAEQDLRKVADLLGRQGLPPEQVNVVAAQILRTFAERPDLARASLAAIKPKP